MVVKEIFSCILLIVDSFGGKNVQLDGLFKFIVLGCNNKAAEIRNEAILVIQQFYSIFGYDILSYLKDIQPSTMAVINQELEMIELPEHLLAKKAADEAKEDADEAKEDIHLDVEDNLLSSSDRNIPDEEYYREDETEMTMSNFEDQHLSVEKEEYSYASFEDNQAKSFEGSSQISKRTDEEAPPKSVDRPKRASKIGRFSQKEQSPEVEHLKILDVGNKDVRDKKDVKVIWTPNELRSDVTKHIRSQIKAAFGAKIEKD